MSPYLAAVLLLIVVAAVAGMVPLRRYADRQWAEHQRWQYVQTLPEFQRIAKNFQVFGQALGLAITPAFASFAQALREATESLNQLAATLPPRPRWKRILDRLYVGRWVA